MSGSTIGRMIRRLVLAITLVAIWLGVLGWNAGLHWNTPLVPGASHAFFGSEFHARIGAAQRTGQALQVKMLAADGTALQSVMLGGLRAADTPVLRYRIANFPRTLELALVFRRGDAPEDVQTISLPAPGVGENAVDLSSLAEWRGEITELGFAEYAMAQLVPPSAATEFAPFAIERVELQSPAWSQLAQRLRTDWFAYRPWSLRSEHTLGTQFETIKSSSMQFAVGIGVLLSLLAVALLLRPVWRDFAMISAAASVAAWIVLDLRWLIDLEAKHRLTETLYAGKPWALREELQPDEATKAAASEVTRLAAENKVSRVLVGSDSNYTGLRFVYFLLPLNAVTLGYAMNGGTATELHRDTLIALLDSDWRFDAATSTLQTPYAKYPVAPLYEKDGLRVYRSTGEGR